MSIQISEVAKAFPEYDFTNVTPAFGGFKLMFPVKHDGQMVALKISLDPQDVKEGQESDPRSLREIELMGKFDHPGIIRIVQDPAVRQIDSREHLWYLEEYCANGTLEQSISDDHGEDLAIALIRHLLPALDYLWSEHQVVHRDIKPSNIGIKTNHEFVLLDLGIALATNLSRITNTFEIAPLTPAYAAPEQSSPRAGASLDIRTDLYALGVVTFECLTGAHPLQILLKGPQAAPINTAHAWRKTMEEKTRHAQLINFVLRTLEVRQNRRFKNAQVALKSLEGIL